jgi:hypothetical protein
MATIARPLRFVKQFFQRRQTKIEGRRGIHSLGSVAEMACAKGNLNNEIYPLSASISCQRHSHSGAQPCNGYPQYIDTMANASCMDPREPSENVSRTPLHQTFAVPKYITSTRTSPAHGYRKTKRSLNSQVPTSPVMDENLVLYENQLNVPEAAALQDHYALCASFELGNDPMEEMEVSKDSMVTPTITFLDDDGIAYDMHNFPGNQLVAETSTGIRPTMEHCGKWPLRPVSGVELARGEGGGLWVTAFFIQPPIVIP